MRSLSRTPRKHRHPAWSTTPPIANDEDSMEQPHESLTKMRQVLRGMVLVVTDMSPERQSKFSSMLEGTDDTRLAALAQEALTNITRAKASYDRIEAELRDMRKTLERFRTEHAAEERALLEAQKAFRERDDFAAKLKELKKQVDPEKQQLEIMYAIDEATAKLKEESSGLRRELGQRQTEVEQLRASKKRLREALDRLAGKD